MQNNRENGYPQDVSSFEVLIRNYYRQHPEQLKEHAMDNPELLNEMNLSDLDVIDKLEPKTSYLRAGLGFGYNALDELLLDLLPDEYFQGRTKFERAARKAGGVLGGVGGLFGGGAIAKAGIKGLAKFGGSQALKFKLGREAASGIKNAYRGFNKTGAGKWARKKIAGIDKYVGLDNLGTGASYLVARELLGGAGEGISRASIPDYQKQRIRNLKMARYNNLLDAIKDSLEQQYTDY